MKFGTPIAPADLLALLVDQVRRTLDLNRTDVFESLLPDQLHMDLPPADVFCTVAAGGLRSPVDAGVAGGGRYLTGYDLSPRLVVFSRIATGQELRSADVLRDRTRGLLNLGLTLVDGMQMWEPQAPDGTCHLREPARLSPGGMTCKAGRDAGANYWSMLESTWSVKFTAPLRTDPLVGGG